VDPRAARAVAAWTSGTAQPSDEQALAHEVVSRLGFDARLVQATGDSRTWLPAAVRRRVSQAVQESRPEWEEMVASRWGAGRPLPESGEMALRSVVRFLKMHQTRGSFRLRSRHLLMNTMDHANQVSTHGGFRVGITSTARLLAQDVIALGLPMMGLSPLRAGEIVESGIEAGAAAERKMDRDFGFERLRRQVRLISPRRLPEAMRRAFQKAGDAAAHAIGRFLGVAKYRIEVNKILEGSDEAVSLGGHATTYRALRDVGVRYGVGSAFDASQVGRLARMLDDDIAAGARGEASTIPRRAGRWAYNQTRDWIDFTGQMAEAWAERERFGAFASLIETGMDPETAARVTVEALFDYAGSTTAAERSWWLSLILPYWAYQKNANRYIFDNMFHPRFAWRMGVLRRAQMRGPEVLSEVLYDRIYSPYGVDEDEMDPEAARAYWLFRDAVENGLGPVESWPASWKETLEEANGPVETWDKGDLLLAVNGYGGVENVPPDVRMAMTLMFSGRHMENVGGDVALLHPALRGVRLPWVEEFALPSPATARGARTAHYETMPIFTIPTEAKQRTRDFYAQVGSDHQFMELAIPDTTLLAGTRWGASWLMAGFVASQQATEWVTGEDKGAAALSPWTPLEEIVSPSRAMLIRDILASVTAEERRAPPRRISAVSDAVFARFLPGVPVHRVAVIQDPLAPPDTPARREARAYLPPGLPSLLFFSLPSRDLDATIQEAERTARAADIGIGGGVVDWMLRTGLATPVETRAGGAVWETPSAFERRAQQGRQR
ncbi:MAG: hypothetical protein QME96_04770, partial [Myxococcota bacterium]|nr:hypothetical protein [Myxococcota bacterium]